MKDATLRRAIVAGLDNTAPDEDGRIYIFHALETGGVDFWIEPAAIAGERQGFRAEVKGSCSGFAIPQGTSPVEVAEAALFGYLELVRQ